MWSSRWAALRERRGTGKVLIRCKTGVTPTDRNKLTVPDFLVRAIFQSSGASAGNYGVRADNKPTSHNVTQSLYFTSVVM
jgi:hypothetical protein